VYLIFFSELHKEQLKAIYLPHTIQTQWGMFDQLLESRERVTRRVTPSPPRPARAVGAPPAPLCPSTLDPLAPVTTPTSSQFSSPLPPLLGPPPLGPSCSVELVDWGTDDEDDEPGIESQASPSPGCTSVGPSSQPQVDLAVSAPVETRSSARGPVVIALTPLRWCTRHQPS
jgi:hypothetical protein